MPGVIVALALTISLIALIAAPGGCLTKADLVGYAVCHRAPSHSFHIAGRQLPLCARCTGTFLGALVGFVGQGLVLRRRRASRFPPPFIIALLVSFMALWAADGLNSYVSILGARLNLYEPQNWLRLTTGALNGLTMSALVYPVFNFTVWVDPTHQRAVRNLRDLAVLLLLEAAVVALVLTGWSFLIYPLAVLSAVGVLTLLTAVNSMLFVMLMERENMVATWREAIIPLLAGFTVGLIEIGAIDAIRYAITGTLEGFAFP